MDETDSGVDTTYWADGFSFDNYRIIKLLGEGSSGLVYLAEDTRLERRVAIKLSRVSADRSQRTSERFLREAKSVAGLRHPNICQIYDVGKHLGHYYIAMSYVQGQTLCEWLETAEPSELQIVQIVSRCAEALQVAHRHGVIHRDLKPANILISDADEPVITDFGLAVTKTSQLSARLTQPGLIVGSPAYMSPEQIRDPSTVGPATDIYSLGVVMYQMLCGRLPYTGELMTVIRKIALEAPQPPAAHNPAIASKINSICLKAIEKDPEHRFESMSEFALALDQADSTADMPGLGNGSRGEAYMLEKSGGIRWGIAATALSAMVVLASIFFARDLDPTVPRETSYVAAKESLTSEEVRKPTNVAAENSPSRRGSMESLRLSLLNKYISEGVTIETRYGRIDTPINEFPTSVVSVDTTEFEGFDHDELFDVLDLVPEYRRLYLRTNDFAPAAWELLVQQGPRELSIEADELTDAELDKIGQLQDIVWLEICCPDLADSQLKMLSKLRNLEILSLTDCGIRGTCLQYLRDFDLHGLNLTNTNIDAKHLALLGSARRIGSLCLAETSIDARGLAHLKEINRLTDLDLRQTSITNEDLKQLEAVPLKGLYLTGCTNITDLSPIAHLPLEQLEIQGTHVSDLNPLRGKGLVDLWVDLDSIDDWAVLRTLSSLEKINGIPIEDFDPDRIRH